MRHRDSMAQNRSVRSGGSFSPPAGTASHGIAFHDVTFDAQNEAWRVLDLIVAEFVSDPMSVQCFDARVVERAKAVIEKRKELERKHEMPRFLTDPLADPLAP